MDKKTYENLEISVVLFEAKDVIVASGTGENVIRFNLDSNEMLLR